MCTTESDNYPCKRRPVLLEGCTQSQLIGGYSDVQLLGIRAKHKWELASMTGDVVAELEMWTPAVLPERPWMVKLVHKHSTRVRMRVQAQSGITRGTCKQRVRGHGGQGVSHVSVGLLGPGVLLGD